MEQVINRGIVNRIRRESLCERYDVNEICDECAINRVAFVVALINKYFKEGE